jgi:RimJ/RimL family protein N-acetyltransferase
VKSISAALAAGTEYAFAVCERGAIVACAGVMPRQAGAVELGYWVAAQARGKGVATEAAGATALFAFERLGAEPMLAGHFTDNPGSGRVLAKLGFKPTGETVKTFSAGRGGEADTVRMKLARTDFRAPDGVRIQP